MVFGRKGVSNPPAPPPASPEDGRAWVDGLFKRDERPGSMGYAQALGQRLFDDAYQAMKNDRGVRIEDMAAMLASVGGHLCLTGVLDALKQERRPPEDVGIVMVRGNDGNIFYYGDAPNWLLCEAPQSLISLVFGAAHQHGAPVSIDMLHDEMRLIAQRVGTPEFLELGLPQEHHVDSPISWARHFTPFVINSIKRGGTPDLWAPVVIGFALQQAVDHGKEALDPMMVARIALACALRAAKIDPDRVAAA